MDELLRIENLAVEYQSERAVAKALNGINLTIGKGESLGLVGETGAGKPRLLYQLFGCFQNELRGLSMVTLFIKTSPCLR